jgi:peptidoglycan/LPS O-acetylase OafA/YrhL
MVVVLAINNSMTFDGRNFVGVFMVEKPSVRIQAISSIIFLLLMMLLRPYDKILMKNLAIRILCYLGIISYSLYLTHTLIQPIIDVFLRRIGFDKSLYIYNYIMQILVSVIFGCLFYLAIERHFISSRQKKRVLEEKDLNALSTGG